MTSSDAQPAQPATQASEAAGAPTRHELMARAVLRHGPEVLLARLVDHDFWFLPGGPVLVGDSATRSLRRELKQELDLDVEVGDLMGVAENLYTLDGRTHHELNLVFDVRISGRVDHSHNPALELRWFGSDVLAGMDIRPPALATMVSYGPGSSRMRLLSNGLPLT